MLTEGDKRKVAAVTQAEVERLELDLLLLASGRIAELDAFESYEIVGQVGRLSIDALAVVRKRSRGLYNAIERDLRAEFERNGLREQQIAERAGKPFSAAIIESTAANAAAKAVRQVSPVVSAMLNGVTASTVNAYVFACEKASVMVNVVGTEGAMRQAVRYLARNGITQYSYTRANGTQVFVPIDVGIKKAIVNAGQRGRMAQTLQIAYECDQDLVEVSTTANSRASHAEWQGQIYSLSGTSRQYKPFQSSCNVGDPVDGIGGYNCGHEVAIYYPGIKRTFDDPLKGTGYTTEQVRKLTDRQRELERGIRADKREAILLESVGQKPTDANAAIREKQAALRSLISENPVLWRDYSRERLYGA